MIIVDWKSFIQKRGRKDKNTFPTGSKVYTGFQGDGKTISMIHDMYKLKEKYPKAIVYGNVKIKLKDYKYIDNDDDLAGALSAPTPPGCPGTLIMLDEAHLFFNKKKGIPIEVLTAISQQRKDRKRLIFTSQIWEELDLSIRKQVKEICKCRRIGIFQLNHLTDGETLCWNNLTNDWEARSIGWSIFKHTKELYESYDTRQKIARVNEYVQRTPTGRP